MKAKNDNAGRRGARSRGTSNSVDAATRVFAAMADTLREFRRELRRCRRDADPEAVHQLRVQTRRLLVWCELMKALDSGSGIHDASRKLRKLLRTMARLRDLQVQLKLLKGVPDRLAPAARLLRRELRREKPHWIRRVNHRCHRIHPARIRTSMGAGHDRGKPSRRDDLEGVLREWLSGLESAACRRLKAVRAARPETLHRLRIAVKHLRYGLEAAARCVPGISGARIARLRTLQGSLGAIQDLDVGWSRLKSVVPADAREEKSLGALARWLEVQRDSRIRRLSLTGSRRDPVPLGLRVVRARGPVASSRP